ncbi:hypothetical protein ACFXTO_003522 [Malus domestica]
MRSDAGDWNETFRESIGLGNSAGGGNSRSFCSSSSISKSMSSVMSPEALCLCWNCPISFDGGSSSGTVAVFPRCTKSKLSALPSSSLSPFQKSMLDSRQIFPPFLAGSMAAMVEESAPLLILTMTSRRSDKSRSVIGWLWWRWS